MLDAPAPNAPGPAPWFATLPPPTRAQLLAHGATRAALDGSVLFAEGTPARCAHVVLSGRVGLMASGGTASHTVIDLAGPDEVLMLSCALLGQACAASGVALGACRLLDIPAAALRVLSAQDAALGAALVDALAHDCARMVEELKDLKLRDGIGRVARWLVSQGAAAGEAGGRVALLDPKALLARRLGMTPESFSRTLAALEARGLIRRLGRAVALSDRAGLAALVHGQAASCFTPPR